mmetsp:Transcript_4755/g.15857  ORF Transcript_4755/g.15857 Transcript_4755/m.15857 type:complete len:225 (-) Transcript_4755:183-857(-)
MDIPSAFSAALSTSLGAFGIPINPFSRGSNKSLQSRGGGTPFGSLSFLYANIEHPNRYGAPYTSPLVLIAPLLGSLLTSACHIGDNPLYHAERSHDPSGNISPFEIAGASHSSPSVHTSTFLIFFPPDAIALYTSATDGAVFTFNFTLFPCVDENSRAAALLIDCRNANTSSGTSNAYADARPPSYAISVTADAARAVDHTNDAVDVTSADRRDVTRASARLGA